MPHAQHSVTIARPVETVFAYVADGEKCPQWRSVVLDIARVSGDGSVGTEYRQGVSGPMGRRIAADYQVRTYEPNRLIEFQTMAGPVRPHGRYEFVEADSGTRLTFSLDAELRGLKSLVLGSSVSKTMASEVKALDDLKRVLESQA
jgi:uncharacterized protein YndB with AHSA1/START domain